jgi:hypothetical protein
MARKLSKKYKDLLLRLISHVFIFHLNKIIGFCTIRRKGSADSSIEAVLIPGFQGGNQSRGP